MFYVTIILLLLAIVLFIRLYSLKKEMKKITWQLQIYINRKSNKKIDMTLLDKDIENFVNWIFKNVLVNS